jgi:hypothetical protein
VSSEFSNIARWFITIGRFSRVEVEISTHANLGANVDERTLQYGPNKLTAEEVFAFSPQEGEHISRPVLGGGSPPSFTSWGRRMDSFKDRGCVQFSFPVQHPNFSSHYLALDSPSGTPPVHASFPVSRLSPKFCALLCKNMDSSPVPTCRWLTSLSLQV